MISCFYSDAAAPTQVLKKVGTKHGVSISAVAARWVLQQQQVAAVVLGARNTSHLRVSKAQEG
jgi:aryl-alcohol dehydrogenase-like predicted oxidoreductase